MSRLIRQTSPARADAREIYLSFARDSVERADEFWSALESTYDTLLRMPALGEVIPCNRVLKEVRRWRVLGYERYLIFYSILDDGIEIIRIIHGAQDWWSMI